MPKSFQTFNDGVVVIYSVGNTAKPGMRPQEGLAEKERLRFDERTVGVKRFYEAKAAQERIDIVIRVQRRDDIETGDVAELNGGKRYVIRQIQHPKDVVPKSCDLSLERITGDTYEVV